VGRTPTISTDEIEEAQRRLDTIKSEAARKRRAAEILAAGETVGTVAAIELFALVGEWSAARAAQYMTEKAAEGRVKVAWVYDEGSHELCSPEEFRGKVN
jgi:hypothetical protein